LFQIVDTRILDSALAHSGRHTVLIRTLLLPLFEYTQESSIFFLWARLVHAQAEVTELDLDS